MIIDAHTCFHPYEMKGIRLTEDEFIKYLDKFEIEKAMVCCPFYLLSDFIFGNEKILNFMRRYPDRIIGFATINPLFEKEAIKEIERCINKGMKGVKLHCDLSQVPYNSVLTFPVVEKCIELKIPIFLHTEEDSIKEAVFIAEKYPEATFVFAHIGNTAWRETLSFVKEKKNVILCLSGNIFEIGFLEESVKCVGDERVVYGSDFVFVNPAINLGIIKKSSLPEESKNKILYLNAKRVYKI